MPIAHTTNMCATRISNASVIAPAFSLTRCRRGMNSGTTIMTAL